MSPHSRMCSPLVVGALALTLALSSSPAWGQIYLDVVISEIMYNPAGQDAPAEYIELTNRGNQAVNLTGWKIGDGIRYSFPPGTMLAAGARLVLAGDPAGVQAEYGISGVLGPWEGMLDNNGERIEIRDAADGLVNEVDYDDEAPWPTGGDGDGRSIELTDLARNNNVGRFWLPSTRIQGTPGAANAPGLPSVTIRINEFVANPGGGSDWVELYNYGDTAVNLNGYYLTDNARQPTKARISGSWSAGTTIIPAKGYWLSNENDWGFGLSSGGEQLHLVAPDGVTWVDGVDYGQHSFPGHSQALDLDEDGWFMSPSPTPGAANVRPSAPPVVINEIMYQPLGDTPEDVGPEYLELHNRGGATVDVSGWALGRGIDYDFPPGTLLAAGGYLVIAKDPLLVQNTYGLSGVLGPYEGILSNFSDEIELEDALGNRVDFVEYRQEGLWPEAADGTGPSLELANYTMDNRLPGAWRASSGTGTPGAANSRSLANPAASVDRVAHSPLVPTSSEAVSVTALVGAGNLTAVTLFYKRDPDGTYLSTPMFDDGLHGDRLGGDGVYGGTIPPYPNGTIVEFYIQANATGGGTRFPANGDADYFIPTRTCLYIVEDIAPTSNLTVFRIVINDENHAYVVNSPYHDGSYDHRKRDCTFIHGDRAYYNSEIRLRGGGRGGPKYSYRIKPPAGYHFRGSDRFALNYEKNERTLLKNVIFYHFLEAMGLPSAKTEFIHTRYRNSFAGVHYYAEKHCADYLDKYFPDDSEGNLYKAVNPWTTATAWNESRSGYEKETNEQANDWSDLAELGNITSNEPDATYEGEVRRVVDITNWCRSYAALCVGCMIDTPWHFHNQNYRIYRRLADNRFIHLLYDFDDGYWDTMYASAGPDESEFPDVVRFFNWPSFRREYYHGIWRAINTNDGVFRESRVAPEVAYYHGLIYNDVLADPYSGSGSRRTDFINAKSQWNTWLNTRNTLLRGFLPTTTLAITTNGGLAITTASPNLILQGTAPLSAPRLEVFGSEAGIDWPSVTQWRRNLALVRRNNTVVVRTLDDAGNEIARVSVQVTYTNGLPDGPDFIASVLRGVPPLAVQFTDTSAVAGASAWAWDFGDNQTSSLQNPSHTYTEEGLYTVRLTVTGTGGPQTAERVDYIHVAVFPRAAFISSGSTPTATDAQIIKHLEGLGLTVTAYDDEPANRPTAAQIAATHGLVLASSSVLSANVAGEFRSQPVPFIYWESSLSWADREGLASANSISGGQTHITVLNSSHPIMQGVPTGNVAVTTSGADFSWVDQLAPGVTPLATIVGSPSRRTIVVAEPGTALLGGPAAVDKRVMLFLYDTTWLTVNATGRQIFDNTIVYTMGTPAADFTAAHTVGMAPLTVQFTDESTGPGSSWSWNFGDGGTSKMRHPVHAYTQPGTYSVTLTVTGLGRSDTMTRTDYITVALPAQSDYNGDGDVDGADYLLFQSCATGPAIPYAPASLPEPPPGCTMTPDAQGRIAADTDEDGDVDQADFGAFQSCFGGADTPPPPGCAR
ncbi:MAG: hypothetical protein AMXMBFR13_43330 [Phycisphaerae bacterium]